MKNIGRMSIFRYKKFLSIILLIVFLNAVLTGVTTYFYGESINRLESSSTFEMIAFAFLFYFILQIFILIFNIINSLILNKITSSIMKNLRNDVMCSILKRKEFQKVSKHDLDFYVSGLINDVKYLDNQYVRMEMQLVSLFSRIITFCVILFFYSWIMFALSIISLSVVFIVSFYSNKSVNEISKQLMESKENYLSRYKSNIDAYPDFTYVNRKQDLLDKLHDNNLKFENIDLKFQKKIIKITSINTIIKSIGFIVIILTAIMLANYNILRIGAVLASFEFVSMLTSDVGDVISSLQAINTSKPSRDKVSWILANNNDLKDNYLLKDSINFNNVNISIQYKKILKNINITFKSGKKYVLFGESGSGKTTIINTLLGINDEVTGEILIDGIKFSKFKTDYNLKVSYIDQNKFLFNDTILNNILVGRDIDEIEQDKVIYNNNLLNFVNSLDDGLNYQLENDAYNISGGEKQRIIFIRSIIENANLCIFDESFSEIDVNTLEKIEEYIANLEDTTIIYITHKLVNPQFFDKIYYLKNGEVYE